MMNGNIDSNNIIARFLFDRKHYSQENNRVKYPAFIPPTQNPDELSVYIITGLNDLEIWNLGDEYVAKFRDKPLKARGDLNVSDVIQVESIDREHKYLRVISDTKVHRLHANITNLPNEKAKRKLVALKLERLAKLRIRDDMPL